MKQRFTKLLAAVALLVFMMPSMVAWGQTRTETTIASWGKVSIAANTAIIASGGDANNNGVAQYVSTKAMTSEGTYCYYGSSAGGAVITFSNLDLSGYENITMTFYTRASQQGTMQISWSADGITYTDLNAPSITKSEAQKTSDPIPNTATYIKLSHNKTSGSLYFGTIEIKGTASSGGGPTQLSAPTLTATPDNEKVTLEWSAIGNASSYTIQYADNSSFTGATTVTNATSPKEITGLTNGTPYYFKAMTVGDGTNYLSSDYGDVVSATPANVARITITQGDLTDFTNSYAWYDWSAGNVSGKAYAYKNGGMQFNSGKPGYWIYNISAIPGTITSVKMVKASGTDRSWTLKAGTSEISTIEDGIAIGNPQTVGTSGATWAVGGSYNYFLLYVSGGSTVISSIEITYIPSTDPIIVATDPEALAYNASGGEFNYSITNPATGVNLSAASNSDWITNVVVDAINSKVTFNTSTNIGAQRQGTITLSYTGATDKVITITQDASPTHYTTIPELFAGATSTATDVLVSFNNWVVSGVSTNGKNVFVTDNAGNGFVIYDSNAGLASTYAVGNILSGTAVPCSLKLNQGYAQLTNVSGLAINTGGTVTSANIAMVNLAGVNTGALVSYNNLTCSLSNSKYYLTDGTTTLQVYNALYAFNELEAGKTYNITGIYQQYGDTKEILPRSAADIEEVIVPSISADNVNITCEQTGGSIAFTVNHPVNGGTISASSTDSWITLGNETTSPISFTCSANTGAARTATVTLTYTYNTNQTVTKDVTIIQAAYVPTPTSDSFVRITSLDQLTDGSIVVIAARYDENATNYYAMANTLSNKKFPGTAFVSSSEMLPNTITNSIASYYWIVSITTENNVNKYTFTNANGDIVGWLSSTDFLLGNENAHNEWTIERETSGSNSMVHEYTGFVVRNFDTDTRAFAFNGSLFGPYSTTNNINASGYNFFLDFFVQMPTCELPITGYTDGGGWNLIASPVVSIDPVSAGMITDTYGSTDVTPENGTYDLYRFNQSAELEWENYRVHSFALESGKGYLYASKEGVSIQFAGAPYNSGEIPLVYDAGKDFAGWNLIGNPFGVAATLDIPYYRMNENQTTLGAKIEGGQIAAMEGVFVYAYDADEQQAITKATFTRAGRSNNAPQGFVNLNVEQNASVVDNVIVRFDEGRSLPKLQLFKGSAEIFITKNGKDYAIVNSEAQGEMPVNFKAQKNGTYILNIDTENVEMNYLHLIDNMTGMDVDLLQTPSYTFDATTNDYASRFRLVFSANDVNEQNAETFAFFSNGNWVVGNEGEATLQVIDVNGRIVSNETINGTVATSINATPGVYMLRLVNGNEVKTQKIVVK